MAPTVSQSLDTCLHKSAYSPAKISFFKIPFYYFTEHKVFAIADSNQAYGSWNSLYSILSSTSKIEYILFIQNTCFKNTVVVQTAAPGQVCRGEKVRSSWAKTRISERYNLVPKVEGSHHVQKS